MDLQEDEEVIAQQGGFSGAARAALRSVLRRISHANIGAIPKVNPRVIAKQADALSDIANVGEKIRSTYDLHKEKRQSEAAASSSSSRWQRGKRMFVVIAHSLPSIIRSSLLGAALFSAYETCEAKLSGEHVMLLQHTSPALVPVLSGLVAGFTHGSLYFAADRAMSIFTPYLTTTTHAAAPLYLPGTLFCHSMVHLTLFTTYSLSKYLFLGAQHRRHLQGEGSSTDNKEGDANIRLLLAISGAGVAAGALSELATHYLSPFERAPSLQKGLHIARRLTLRPSFSGLAMAALPSGLGFLAFEFG